MQNRFPRDKGDELNDDLNNELTWQEKAERQNYKEYKLLLQTNRRRIDTQLDTLEVHCRENNLDAHVFLLTTEQIIHAINNQISITDEEDELVNISEAITSSNFRFISRYHPQSSYSLSNTISFAVDKAVKKATQLVSEKAIRNSKEKRKENADEFAARIYPEIERLKLEQKVTSFRETANMLNEQKLETFRGGKWHTKTLRDIYNRCKDLGIIEADQNIQSKHAPKP